MFFCDTTPRPGAKQLRLSVKGGLSLAVRRAVASVAACHIGKVLLENVAHTTVTKWELFAAASLQGTFRNFHRAQSELHAQLVAELVDDAAAQGGADAVITAVCGHAFESDATNSYIWQWAKLQGLHLTTACVHDLLRLAADLITQTFLERIAATVKSGWADVVRVTSSTTAATHALVSKQLRSLGCEPWYVPRPSNVLQLWFNSADGGPDVRKLRKIAKVEVHAMGPNHVWFDADCGLHSEELIVRSHIVRVDVWLKFNDARLRVRFTYFGSLAKFFNIWRDQMRLVYLLWLRGFGAESANLFAMRATARPIAGR